VRNRRNVAGLVRDPDFAWKPRGNSLLELLLMENVEHLARQFGRIGSLLRDQAKERDETIRRNAIDDAVLERFLIFDSATDIETR
jgi:hypothetical protein